MISTHFQLNWSQNTRFVIDTDETLDYLSAFNSSSFQRFVIVLDKNIKDSFFSLINNALSKHKKEIIIIEVVPNEINKGIDQTIELIKTLEDKSVGRFDLLISIGGGFVSDITGFVSSIYMRGIPFIAIPTTLVGQVDAVTAGKTCINGPNTKNLLGTFYFPRFVYINTLFLSTLPKRELRQGWSEIFKYALLDSHLLIDLMQKYFDDPSNLAMTKIIEETIRIRMKIRKVDPLASNLGHTFGHAFEKISNYKISHGDAISIGTLMAIQFGEKKGITRSGLHDEILTIMNNLELNTKFHEDFLLEEVTKIMLKDKKSSNKEINLVLISDIAKPFYNKKDLFFSVRPHEMTNYLSEYSLQFSDRLDNKLYENL